MPLAELVALLHLASPALPIGGFSYSQGLEAAVEAGVVHDGPSAQHWIAAGLDCVLARCDLPFIAQQMDRWQNLGRIAGDGGDEGASRAASNAALAAADAWYLASRESAELRQETEQMGWSLASLCNSLEWGSAARRATLMALKPVSLPTVFAYASAMHAGDVQATLAAYAFSWVENQVAAALKAVPLGQLAGQRVLFGLRDAITAAAERAAGVPPAELSTFAPLLGILSSQHELQYSRLFRS